MIYEYQCPVCKKIEENYVKLENFKRTWFVCREHRPPVKMKSVISTPRAISPDIEPYVDDNMGHDPVQITSRRHKKALLKKNNLVEIG